MAHLLSSHIRNKDVGEEEEDDEDDDDDMEDDETGYSKLKLNQFFLQESTLREQGWRSGESTCLPPMWPEFVSRTRRHMWVEFVVGSCPCSEGFSSGSQDFLPSQKLTFPNSYSTWNTWIHLKELRELFGALWLNEIAFFLFNEGDT